MKVLLVDDNAMYRSAFRRNLLAMEYEVCEAEHADDAMANLRENSPDVVVTDLSMRTQTEGLELIRQLKQFDPLLPVVMISAVGTFEEGAEAMRLGAARVISKSRIDEEMDSLYKTLEQAHKDASRNREVLGAISAARTVATSPAEATATPAPNSAAATARAEALARLREIAADATLQQSVRAEAYDAVLDATENELRAATRSGLQKAMSVDPAVDLTKVDAALSAELGPLEGFDPDSLNELRTAEFFHLRQKSRATPAALAMDFSRNIGFSYCFAVENEAKARLRKRIQKFLSAPDTYALIKSLLEPRSQQLDLFYHQYLLRLQQQLQFDFTVDNLRQTFQRILEHESRYKPDGLKALGILIVCFGREYSFRRGPKTMQISNPLGLRGFANDNEVLQFAFLLVSLQHYRNPYIHPEITEMEKVSKLRTTALECLRAVVKLS